MRIGLTLFSLLLATPALSWEARVEDGICVLDHSAEDAELRVTYDPSQPLYTIALSRLAGLAGRPGLLDPVRRRASAVDLDHASQAGCRGPPPERQRYRIRQCAGRPSVQRLSGRGNWNRPDPGESRGRRTGRCGVSQLHRSTFGLTGSFPIGGKCAAIGGFCLAPVNRETVDRLWPQGRDNKSANLLNFFNVKSRLCQAVGKTLPMAGCTPPDYDGPKATAPRRRHISP